MSIASEVPATTETLDVGQLFAAHGAFVTRLLTRLTGEGAHVDDLVQDCFVAAFAHRADYVPERAAATTWLYGIAVNVARQHRRGRWRLGRLLDRVATHELATPTPAPDAGLEDRQRAAMVHAALQKLPFKQREVFALYELEGVDGATIAAMLDVPEGTVWTRLAHARGRFSTLMRHRLAKEERA